MLLLNRISCMRMPQGGEQRSVLCSWWPQVNDITPNSSSHHPWHLPGLFSLGHMFTSPTLRGFYWFTDTVWEQEPYVAVPVGFLTPLLVSSPQAGSRAHVRSASPSTPQLWLQPPTANSTTHGTPAQVFSRRHGLVSLPHFPWIGCLKSPREAARVD